MEYSGAKEQMMPLGGAIRALESKNIYLARHLSIIVPRHMLDCLTLVKMHLRKYLKVIGWAEEDHSVI